MNGWLFYGCLWLGFVSAVVGGVFLGFSDFIMGGLKQAEASAGADSMRQINRTVFRSVFLTSFLSLVPLTAGFALYAWYQAEGLGQLYCTAAALIYLLAVFLVTIAGNVPMNNRLDVLHPDDPAADDYWQHYARVWTRWNHVRTMGCLATAALFLLAAAALAR